MKNLTLATQHYVKPIVFVAAIVFFAACSVRKEQADASGGDTAGVPLVGTYWKLVEIAGNPVDTGLNSEPFIQFDAEDNRVGASGGCNTMGGTYDLKPNNRLQFSQMISTMMACPNMEVEAALSDVLGRTDSYAIQGDTLSLFRARMAPLARFVAVPENQRAAAVLNGTWRLDYIGGVAETLDELFPNEKPTITFDMGKLHVSGQGGCNRYSGGFTVDNHAISFGELATTRMYCQGVQETVYFQSLSKINTFDVSDNGTTLNLIMGDIAMMRFTKE